MNTCPNCGSNEMEQASWPVGTVIEFKCWNCKSLFAQRPKEIVSAQPIQEAGGPNMKVYEIWTEGFSVTGQNGEAIFHGTYEGKDFRDAVITFVKSGKLSDPHLFSEEHLTYWGCRFFDNGTEARKSFG